MLAKINRYPFTHSIAMLINEALKIDEDFNYLLRIRADLLSKYYVDARHPPLTRITEQDARKAVVIARKVEKFILRKLNLPVHKL